MTMGRRKGKGSLFDFTLSCGSRDADEGQAGAGGGQSLALPAKEGQWRIVRSRNDP